MSEWIQKFKGRNGSSACNLNFLWRHENVYIMDNHRAALWCWLQHIDLGSKHGLFHIDAHYDMAKTLSENTLKLIPDLNGIALEDYLNIMQPDTITVGSEIPIIRWDNYLTLFELRYSYNIGEFFTATHKLGDKPPDTIHWEEIEINKLSDVFSSYLEENGHSGWILNLDLDYFFTFYDEAYQIFLSDSYINEIFESIKIALDQKSITVLTICLSPECTGGWKNSEQLCSRLCQVLEIEFELPTYADKLYSYLGSVVDK